MQCGSAQCQVLQTQVIPISGSGMEDGGGETARRGRQEGGATARSLSLEDKQPVKMQKEEKNGDGDRALILLRYLHFRPWMRYIHCSFVVSASKCLSACSFGVFRGSGHYYRGVDATPHQRSKACLQSGV